MRIVIALDTQTYSGAIISEAANLAANTWADVTLLGVQKQSTKGAPEKELGDRLLQYSKEFLSRFEGETTPYGTFEGKEAFSAESDGWQLVVGKSGDNSKKQLRVKIRVGDTVREILAEAGEQECDLLVMGCSGGLDCQWDGEIDLPQKIARKADYSVLVIKEKIQMNTIVCCLDQQHVNQSSLEMINQMVTLHQAELKIVGLTNSAKGNSKESIEKKMGKILKYYADLELSPWVKLVRQEDLEAYVAQASSQGMIALLMGKKSPLKKIFSPDLVGKLVNTSRSSVMILR